MLTSHIQFARALHESDLGGVHGIRDRRARRRFRSRRSPDQPSNPALLDALAERLPEDNYSFRTPGKDNHELERLPAFLALCRRMEREYAPYYARKYVRMLSAAELHDAIALATGVPPSAQGTSERRHGDADAGARQGSRRVKEISPSLRADRNRDDMPKKTPQSALQAMLLMQTRLDLRARKSKRCSKDAHRMTTRWSNRLYLTTISRKPTRPELAWRMKALAARPQARSRKSAMGADQQPGIHFQLLRRSRMKTRVSDFFPTRRDILQLVATDCSARLLTRPVARCKARAAGKTNPRGTARFAIVIELAGAISHIDTFDFKEGEGTPKDLDVRPVRNDLYLSHRLFPELSTEMDKVAIIRSMKSHEVVHFRGQYYTQAGRPLNPGAGAGDPSSVRSSPMNWRINAGKPIHSRPTSAAIWTPPAAARCPLAFCIRAIPCWTSILKSGGGAQAVEGDALAVLEERYRLLQELDKVSVNAHRPRPHLLRIPQLPGKRLPNPGRSALARGLPDESEEKARYGDNRSASAACWRATWSRRMRDAVHSHHASRLGPPQGDLRSQAEIESLHPMQRVGPRHGELIRDLSATKSPRDRTKRCWMKPWCSWSRNSAAFRGRSTASPVAITTTSAIWRWLPAAGSKAAELSARPTRPAKRLSKPVGSTKDSAPDREPLRKHVLCPGHRLAERIDEHAFETSLPLRGYPRRHRDRS